MNWSSYFEMMEDWKRLPAYKAEPRVDSLVGFYMRDIVADYSRDGIRGIIPELPIRLGTVKPECNDTHFADRSYKVDFYLLGESGRHYFVEFKTDSGSRREKQDTYLAEAKRKGMGAIVNGIMKIELASSYKQKYGHLIGKLTKLGLLNEHKEFIGRSDQIEIVYVQPGGRDDNSARVINFNWISKWLRDRHGTSDFEVAFASTLARWADIGDDIEERCADSVE